MNSTNHNPASSPESLADTTTYKVTKLINKVTGQPNGLWVGYYGGDNTIAYNGESIVSPSLTVSGVKNANFLNIYALTDRNQQGTFISSIWYWVVHETNKPSKLVGQTKDPNNNNPIKPEFSFQLDTNKPNLTLTLELDGGGLVIIGTLDGSGDLEPEPLQRGTGSPSEAPVTNIGSMLQCPGNTILVDIDEQAAIPVDCMNDAKLFQPVYLPLPGEPPLNITVFHENTASQLQVWQEPGPDEFYYLTVENADGDVVTNSLSLRIDPRWERIAFNFGWAEHSPEDAPITITEITGTYPPIK